MVHALGYSLGKAFGQYRNYGNSAELVEFGFWGIVFDGPAVVC